MTEERFWIYFDDLSPNVMYRAMHLDMAQRVADGLGGCILVEDGDPNAFLPEPNKEEAEDDE